MPDDAPAPVDQPAPDAPAADTAPAIDWQAEVDKWKALARKHEAAEKGHAKELERLRLAAMSDQERAVAEARESIRAEVRVEFGGRLVDAEFRAAAAGRLSPEAIDVLVSSLDRARFLTDDGEPDREAIVKFVEGVAPAPASQEPAPPGFPDLGQGARGGSMALNGDPLLASIKAKLNIR